MTINYVSGNILLSDAHAIVIPVNTMGIAGAGLAKAWATKDPVAAGIYKSLCEKNMLVVGKVTTINGDSVYFLFPTKEHWKNPSRIEWIKCGLIDLCKHAGNVRSLAVPALGCGLGGLSWRDVEPLIQQYMSGLSIPVHIYPPRFL